MYTLQKERKKKRQDDLQEGVTVPWIPFPIPQSMFPGMIFLFLFLGVGKTIKDLGKAHFKHLGFCS